MAVAAMFAAAVPVTGDEIRIFRDREIVVPEFAVREMPLDQVLEALEAASVKADGEGRGIRIVNLTQEPLRFQRITLSVRGQSVRRIADLVGSMLSLWISSDGNTIEVRKSGRVVAPDAPARGG
jgi:hypothetical protein